MQNCVSICLACNASDAFKIDFVEIETLFNRNLRFYLADRNRLETLEFIKMISKEKPTHTYREERDCEEHDTVRPSGELE